MTNIAVLEDNFYLQSHLVSVVAESHIADKVFAFCSNKEFEAHLMSGADSITVLLADLNLPDGSGIKSIELFKQMQPNGISIVISSAIDSETIINAISCGAVGYLHKDDHSFEIIKSIELAIEGHSPISPAIAYKICSEIQTAIPKTAAHPHEIKKNDGVLSPREIEVLNLIARGLSYIEVANTLGLSKNTVPVHIRNIYNKLQANNRSEAVYEARNMGLIE